MANEILTNFFDKLNNGATWSAGVAFKRAAALPLERYAVHASYTDAEDYALNNPVAYPGQVIAVVETENDIEKIKIYFIDENKILQEVGSATLGDESSIILDPETKILSIKGFADADTGTKMIKDSNGNLAWVKDSASEIQGDIAALETGLNDVVARVQPIEDEIPKIYDEIASLGTVLNFAGVLTVDQYADTTIGGIISSTAMTPGENGRPYRIGDVIIIAGEGSEHVVVENDEGNLVWEQFGDPTGITGLETRVSSLEGQANGFDNAIDKLNDTEAIDGSVKNIAKGYADIAEGNAKAHTNAAVETINLTTADHTTRIGQLETNVGTNQTAINNINESIGKDDATEKTIKGRITAIEGTMAKDSDLDALSSRVDTLDSTKLDASEISKYATNEKLASTNSAVDSLSGRVTAAESKITTIETVLNGTEGDSSSGLVTKVNSLVTSQPQQDAKITALENKDLEHTQKIAANETATSNAASVAANADAKAIAAQDSADAAQGTANTAVANAAAADEKAVAAKNAADAAQETANTALSNAASAQTAADVAQKSANTAQETANKNTAKFEDYYTKTEINITVGNLKGQSTDTKDSESIKGAKLYTDEKVAIVNTAIDTLNDSIGNLTNVMNFRGVSSTNPLIDEKDNTSGKVTIDDNVITDQQTGDVIVYDALEFVWTGTKWEIFGNVTADESRFTGIEANIVSLDGRLTITEGEIDALQQKTAGQDTSLNNLGERVNALESEMDDAEDRLTATEIVANAAATQVALQAEIDRATGRENAIEDALNTKSAAINTEINEINDQLTWGTF